MAVNSGEDGGKDVPWMSRSGWLFRFDLAGLAIINAIAFYSYLFWDSLQSGIPALVGTRVDPLFLRGDRFMDWVNTVHSASLATPYGLENQVAMPVYGPLTYALLVPLARFLQGMESQQMLVRLAWVGVTCVVAICLVVNLHRARGLIDAGGDPVAGGLLLPILLSYPFLFAFDRGNLELITLGIVSWYVTRTIRSQMDGALASSRDRRINNLILALAVSIKPYTLLFVALLLTGRCRTAVDQLRKCAISLVEVVLMVLSLGLASLLILYRGDLVRGAFELMFWQRQFSLAYVIGSAGDRFFCSPYVLGKKLLATYAAPDLVLNGYHRLYPFLGFALLAFVLLAAWRFVRHNPYPSVVLAVVSFGLLLVPFNANEYKAIYFLLPFALGFKAFVSENDPVVASGESQSGVFGLTPITVTAGLSFIMLVNRYGLIGDNELASLLTSLLLTAFPVLFLGSFRRI